MISGPKWDRYHFFWYEYHTILITLRLDPYATGEMSHTVLPSRCGFPCLLCLVSLCRTCGSNYEYTLPKHVAVRPCGTDRHELRHGSGGRSSDGQPSRLFDESNTNDARPTHEPGPSFPRSWSNGRRLWAFVQLPARYPKRATSRAQLVPASVRPTPPTPAALERVRSVPMHAKGQRRLKTLRDRQRCRNACNRGML